MTSSSNERNMKDTDMDCPHEILKQLCNENAQSFSSDNTENGQRLYLAFLSIRDNIDDIWPAVLRLRSVMAEYDFDENTPANGYRSFQNVVDSAILHGIKLNREIKLKNGSVLFRKSTFAKEIESCAQLFASLGNCLSVLEMIKENSAKGELFLSEDSSIDHLTIHAAAFEQINQYCFYGRCLGFQFLDSMKGALRVISLFMAIFSEAYYSEGPMIFKATSSLMTSAKFMNDPEERAKRIVNIYKNAEVDFCKAFWFLSEGEIMKHLPSVIAHDVAVSKVIYIPTEPLVIEINGMEIDVPLPLSHIGRKPVQVRLISWKKREGMFGQANKKVDPPSRGLLFHCHGGGFVAQSSRSHEVYLREWSKSLDVPILSVDYSLAPQAPFPRALEEVLYAYCWALKNCALLGTTGERIVAAGDSAGGNLLVGMSMKCNDLGIPPPVGLFLVYTPTFVNLTPSPARLFCIMDPLLPFGFLRRCVMAYAIPDMNKIKSTDMTPETESFEEISESDLVELQAHRSPVSNTSDTLTYESLGSQVDENRYGISDETRNTSVTESNSSQKYADDFFHKFTLDSDGNPVLETSDCNTDVPITSKESQLPGRIAAFINSLRGRIDRFVPSSKRSNAAEVLDTAQGNSVAEDLKCCFPKDPFLSPHYASEEMLKKLPPVKLFTVNLDPCLDDNVMFARKLKAVGNPVTLDVLQGLPHGFLNFSLVSAEAHEASERCTQKILELLDLENLPPLK